PRCFSITGTLHTKLPALETQVMGDSEIQVVSALPIMSAIAHLIPQKASGEPETIDLRLTQIITREQYTRALELWQGDIAVPWTHGERLDLALIERVTAYYITCTPVDEPLPLSFDPKLDAIRTISTFLPYDTVLLANGCLDPGIQARRFVVSVEITGSNDAYGVGLKEWFPVGWRVTPISNDGFWYRSSQVEWIYPKRLAAGETKRIVYQVEVAPSFPNDFDDPTTCCGEDATVVGMVSSELGCCEGEVTGENTVHIWRCLPVILAISRWDVANDRLDVTLSDKISFLQVQRAVAFWLRSAPVPHTCGYTVGYETLKAIVTYWMTNTPVTDALPAASTDRCKEEAGIACYEPPSSYGWFCQMKDSQLTIDFVGAPPVIPAVVDAGPDQVLTCVIPVITLTATAIGGPYTYEWVDLSGQVVGVTRTITVGEPGTYTVTARRANGCSGSDSVIVTQDIVPPTVDAGPDQQLTCAITSVLLDATVRGGTSPYTYTWTNSGGTVVGTGEDITLSSPGIYTLTVTGTNGCSASDSVVVTQDATPPTVNAGPDQQLTCAITSVLLDATVSGGTPPYRYEWTNPGGTMVGTSEDIIVDEPDTYTLTVTGTNGCSASSSVTVTEDITSPTVDAGPDQQLTCAITSVLLDATVSGGTPPYTYMWTNSAGTLMGNSEDITVSSPNTYTLTVIGSNGCSASDSVVVTQDITPPTVDAGPDQQLTCAITSVLLNATVSNGTPPYRYEWTNPGGTMVGTSEDIIVDEPDTYTLTVAGMNGCSASDSVVVTQDIVPPTVDAGHDQQLTCVVTEVLLDAMVSGGTPPYTYAWTNSGGTVVGHTEEIAVSSPDTYTLTVIGTNGCSASDSVVVTQDITSPTVSAGPDQQLTCAITSVLLDATVSGGTPPYTYMWTDSGGTVVGTSADIIVDKQGTYTLPAIGANGCSASDSVIVTQDITPPTINAGSDQQLTCAVTSVLLDATVSGGTPPFTYTWTNSGGAVVGNTEDIIVDEPDAYTLTVTGTNGCSASDSVVVTQDATPPTVNAGPDQQLTCAVTSVLLDAMVNGRTPPYTYTWTNSGGTVVGTSEDIIIDEQGTYTLTAIGANGCSASDSVIVTQDITPPTINAGPDQQLTCAVTSVLLDATVNGGTPPYTYTWTNL
ncbi:hypothetical protein KAW44_01620, partial [Candidatus Bipolaricaulota bacterium]|nr:hypothetical protein [Candidatus Bipolaricaulota bacterium]